MIQVALSGTGESGASEEATNSASGLASEDLSEREAKCEADGNTYSCTALGFAGADNKAVITVEDGKVTSFAPEKEGDYGDEVGDNAYSDKELGRYTDVTLESEIDEDRKAHV